MKRGDYKFRPHDSAVVRAEQMNALTDEIWNHDCKLGEVETAIVDLGGPIDPGDMRLHFENALV